MADILVPHTCWLLQSSGRSGHHHAASILSAAIASQAIPVTAQSSGFKSGVVTMGIYKSEDRPIGIETPLGPDKLLLQSFTGEEQLSGLFRFDLQLLSEEARIAPADIVGKSVDFYVRYPDEEQRFFNGIVSRFVYSGQSDRAHFYQAEVVPWMWLLTRGSDCRVHESEKKKNAKDVIDGLLKDLGFSDYRWDLKRTPEPREFCVQYRETHFDFLTRLLEEEGIYFYFAHEKGRHELVMTDHTDGAFDCRDTEANLLSLLSQPESGDNLTAWNHQYVYTTGRYAHTDYNFENPSTPLLQDTKSLVSLPNNSKFEFYDYPGIYTEKALGSSLANLRMESEEARYNTVQGGSECRSFSPGGRFKLARHHNSGEAGGKWLLTAVRHEVSLGGNYVTGGAHSNQIYRNQFQCQPADVVYRPPYRPGPRIHGIQSAVVVGPAGEEIYTDKYGRVKVQFHWDRLGKKDEKCSHWIRVSQVHAGQGWGMMDLPRIGEEVIVSFLEGNPDRPVIVGRLYNAEMAPPFALPGEKTRRGNTTKSHKATGYNEMSMDDTAGAEQIRINAQFNMDTNVGNNQTLVVGVDRTVTIGGVEAIQIDVDQNLTIAANQTIEIGADMNVSIGGSQTVEIGGNRTESVGGDESFKLGGNQTITIGGDQGVVINGKQTVDVAGNVSVSSKGAIKIEAATSIELIVGGSTIKIDNAGVEIKGPAIKLDGTATASVKSPASTIEGDATLTLKGGMTKIN
jgi:type VI secretion system secreted protein VgrG